MMPAKKRTAGSHPGGFGEATTHSESTRSCTNFQGRRIACFTPVSREWHRHCRTCRAWFRFAAALRVMRATKSARGVRT